MSRWKFLSESGGFLPPAEPKWLMYRCTDDGRRVGAVREGKTGLLAAQGGAGKTRLLCELAVDMASGKPWMGAYEASSPGKVLLVLAEEDGEEARRRLFAATSGLTEKQMVEAADRIMLVPLAGVPCNLLEKDEVGNSTPSFFYQDLVSGVARRGPWRLVILDPLSRFADDDTEESARAATRFVQQLEALSLALDGEPAVWVAHHTTKSSREKDRKGDARAVTGGAIRGSGALVDAVRWASTLTKEDDGGLTFRCVKSNLSADDDLGPVRLIKRGGRFVRAEEESDFS